MASLIHHKRRGSESGTGETSFSSDGGSEKGSFKTVTSGMNGSTKSSSLKQDALAAAWSEKVQTTRSLAAFWFFGLCNNFPYVIMLSAAHDILAGQEPISNGHGENQSFLPLSPSNETNERDCNEISTGAVLLADILPTLLIKVTAPFFMQSVPYGFRVLLTTLFQTASYLLVAFSVSIPMSLLGVVCASISSGIGELTFLSLSAHFDKNAISTWSSGTGGAGVFGALSYAGLTQLGISSRNTVLSMLVMPVVLAFCYYVVLVLPLSVHRIEYLKPSTWLVPLEDECDLKTNNASFKRPRQIRLTFRQKFTMTVLLLKFMIPLCTVYFAEYFINQGMHELVFFPDIWLSHKDQYRWYQVDYQLGVFISRSSVNVVHVASKYLWLFPLLQLANTAIFTCEAYFRFMPTIWIVLALTLFEGFLGGGAYVNTFFNIRQEIEPKYVEFSLGLSSMADSFGIMAAGFSAIPAHNRICKAPLVQTSL